MSLINQMLKDIDKRQGPHTANFSDAARGRLDVPRGREHSLLAVLLWSVAGLGLVAAGVYGFRQTMIPSSPASAPAVTHLPQQPVAVVVAPVSAPIVTAEPVVSASAVLIPPETQSDHKDDAKPKRRITAADDAAARATLSAPVAATVPALSASNVADMPSKSASKKEGMLAPPTGQVTRVVSAEQRADNVYKEALLWVRQGRFSDAQKSLKQALTDNPAHQDARLLYARLLMDEGKVADAKAVLSEGIALKPQTFQVYSALAHAQLMSKEVDQAVLTLERGLPLAGENAEFHALLAAALQQQARHAEAVQHYVVALRQMPDAANWLVGLGVSLQSLNNTSGAVEAYQRALDLGLPASLAQFAREKLSQLGR